jgi:hypothetical protein
MRHLVRSRPQSTCSDLTSCDSCYEDPSSVWTPQMLEVNVAGESHTEIKVVLTASIAYHATTHKPLFLLHFLPKLSRLLPQWFSFRFDRLRKSILDLQFHEVPWWEHSLQFYVSPAWKLKTYIKPATINQFKFSSVKTAGERHVEYPAARENARTQYKTSHFFFS